jgi:hypothetical protein
MVRPSDEASASQATALPSSAPSSFHLSSVQSALELQNTARKSRKFKQERMPKEIRPDLTGQEKS